MLAAGTAIRLWIAFTNRGVLYDIDSAYIVGAALKAHPLHVYDTLRYPYPGGYLPVIFLCRSIADLTGAVYYGVFKVPAIFADAGIGALVWIGCGELGASRRVRLTSVALVAFGPMFVLISGYHGQIDAAGILPAVLAMVVWTRGGADRAWQAGLLIGLGASIKTVPLFMVLALLPTVRSRREALVMLGSAVAVPLLTLVPFLIADYHATTTSLTANKGVPGFGGLSLFVQPGIIHGWLHGTSFVPDSATLWFERRQNELVLVAVLAAGAFARRRRMPPALAASLLWIAVYIANPEWSYQYFVWGLPFFLLAGFTAGAAALQLALALPAAELYFKFAVGSAGWLYLPLIYLTWAGLVLAAVAIVRRPASSAPGAPGSIRMDTVAA
jgi:hypothetical protein